MMSHTDLPVSFRGYALKTAAYVLNRAPSKSVKTTPFEEWHGMQPKLSHLKIWGCEAYVRKLQPDKLESKADKCIFVGYPKETCGYTFYNKSDSKTFVAKTGHFLEKEFLAKELSGRKIDLDEVTDQSLQLEEMATEIVLEPSSTVGAEENGQNDIHNDHDIDDDHDENEEEPFVPRRSSRVRQPTEFYGQLVNAISADESDEPTSYKEATEGPEPEKWLEAMKSEIDSMDTNRVWTLVDIPEDRKAVENKWIFKKKTDADGNVSVYKARLFTKGFRQIQGVDYEETFSPVAMIKSIRILLAIAAYHDYEIWQMDVETAFLNGNIEEEFYMMQLEGFVDPRNAGKVCKLQRSIYGLKQASQSWNLRFDEVIKAFGFVQNVEEFCVYKKLSGSSVAFLVLYVDDILLIGNDKKFLEGVKEYLNGQFSMKDLGEAAYILWIEIYRDRPNRRLALSQSTYIDKILKRFSMGNSKRGLLPVIKGVKLSVTQCPTIAREKEEMSSKPYASAISLSCMLCYV